MNVTCVPPKKSPPLVTPTLTGGRPSRNSFSNVPFVRMLFWISVWLSGGWKSMIGPGDAEVGASRRCASGSSRGSVWMPYSPL